MVRPPPVSLTPPLPLITPLTLRLIVAGGAKAKVLVVLASATLPGSEPGLVALSPTCSVPALTVTPPLKLLAVLVSTTAPAEAVPLTSRLTEPSNAGW